MPQQQIQDFIDSFRARVQAELEAQLAALGESHAREIEAAHRAADAAAEARWAARFDAARDEWQAQLQAEVAAARREAEQQWAAKLDAVQAEWTGRLDRAVAAARTEADERWAQQAASTKGEWTSRLEADVAAVRAEADERWTAMLESTRREWSERLDAEVAAARAHGEQSRASHVDDIRSEWSARLEAEVGDARAEAERRIVAEAARARVEAEQAAAEAVANMRREMDEALAAERERAQAGLDAERGRIERELARSRQAAEAEADRDQLRAGLSPEPRLAVNGGRLLEAMTAIDAARTVSEILGLTVNAAASEAPRASLFVANGNRLDEWPFPGLPMLSTGAVPAAGNEAGMLASALASADVQVSSGDGTGPSAPAFASLPDGRSAIAVPLVLGGQSVAVLYGDAGHDGDAQAPWGEALQILGRHASACMACLTAVRTAQAMRVIEERAPRSQAAATGMSSVMPVSAVAESAQPVVDEHGARRYARLLVSEIRLYNEAAVRVGREKRDLSRRLDPEIERARRLYDERVPASVPARDACFQQELVETLADGDPALLG